MTFDEWVRYGVEAGFCEEGVCDTHEGLQMTEEEQAWWEDGNDPCIPALRCYPQ